MVPYPNKWNSFQNWPSIVVWTCYQRFIQSKGSHKWVRLSFTTFWTFYTLHRDFAKMKKLQEYHLLSVNFRKSVKKGFGNGILLPKFFWPTVRKNCPSDRDFFLNSRLKAENFQTFWDHKNNLFEQWKVITIFANTLLF